MHVALMRATSNELVRMALKSGSEEFLRLIEESIVLLADKKKSIDRLHIEGNLVTIQPAGEAIIVGDIHGDLESLSRVLRESSFLERAREDKNVRLIFLGDYGDRGIYSPEVHFVVLKLKMMFPQKVLLIRGNHEGPEDLLAYPHDLPFYFKRRFGAEGQKAYGKLRELFNHLHTAVMVEKRYVLFHGGLPSRAKSINDIAYAQEKHPRETHLEEILWSDPLENMSGTLPSPRGAGRIFGGDITDRILKMLNVKVAIRGHEPCENGFKINHGDKILTLFSRKGEPYGNEHGAYLVLDLSFSVENANQLERYIRIF